MSWSEAFALNVGGLGTLPRFARTERVKRGKAASAAVPKLQEFIKGVAVTMGVSATARPVGFVRQPPGRAKRDSLGGGLRSAQPPTRRSRPAQYGSRSSRLRTLPTADLGSGSAESTICLGTL